jgi:hypothetical protein
MMDDGNDIEVDMEDLVRLYFAEFMCCTNGVSYGATSSISKNTL